MVLGWQKPDKNDWYETVKVNYGIRPDGSKDFPELPGYDTKSYKVHFEFWRTKMFHPLDKISRYRIVLDKGVDGFRYDMAEMVPYEFWSYMNSAVKMKNPDAFCYIQPLMNTATIFDWVKWITCMTRLKPMIN
jgi:glycosidase